MQEALISLIAAAIAFVGLHFVLSHPLRAPLVKAIGEQGFMGVYSLVALITFAWMIWAFRAVGTEEAPVWDGDGNVLWIIACVLTFVALVLLFGSLRSNPALPNAGAAAATAAQAHGVFAVTRHPMMWSFALWAIAHILITPQPRELVAAGAVLVLALLGAHLQDRKKEALIGAAWIDWERRTSYWPRFGALLRVSPLLWGLALIAWLAITWAHIPLAYVPAGIWRWWR